MEYNSLADIVTKMPIFSCFSVKTSKIEELRSIFYSLFFTKKIELKCVECNSKYPFTVEHLIKKNGLSGKYTYSAGFVISSLDDESFFKYDVVFPKTDDAIIEFTFKCTMNSFHYQKMFLLYTLENGTITIRKIGQKPINTDLNEHMSNEYRNILEKYDSFEDFRHFEQSESRNLLAGSCTYLRRVFEKMVNKMLLDPTITDVQRESAKYFDEKIKLVKNQFDADIQDLLDNSYALLSKGIHELSNEEIEQFYSLMFQVICVQLESESEKEHRINKIKTLKKNINSAVQRFDKK